MKKLYTLFFAVVAGSAVNAQYDLSVTLDNYTANEATSDDPLSLDFKITNSGATAVPTGDSIYWAVNIGGISGTLYTTDDLTPGYVMYTVLSADFPAGASTPTITVADITMPWAHTELGALNGDICIWVLGVNVNAAMPPSDPNLVNNQICVDYTVTSVAGLEGVGMEHFSVYPNPANTEVNFNVGNNEVDYISVFDMSGRQVANIMVNGTVEVLNTSDLENGVYYYQIYNNDSVVKSDKFVVTH